MGGDDIGGRSARLSGTQGCLSKRRKRRRRRRRRRRGRGGRGGGVGVEMERGEKEEQDRGSQLLLPCTGFDLSTANTLQQRVSEREGKGA